MNNGLDYFRAVQKESWRQVLNPPLHKKIWAWLRLKTYPKCFKYSPSMGWHYYSNGILYVGGENIKGLKKTHKRLEKIYKKHGK